MPFMGSRISDNIIRTKEGYLICKNVAIGIEGPLLYLDSELGIGNSNKTIKVYRTKEANEEPATIASFEGKPITDGHPDKDVTVDNWSYYSKGHLQNVRPITIDNKSCIVADLFINDELLIKEILNGTKREVSCGYDTEYILENDKIYQTNIRGNHLAVVQNGRAGPFVSIKDEKPLILYNNSLIDELKEKLQKGVNIMPTYEEIMKKFKERVVKCKNTDEINELTNETEKELNELYNQKENKDAEPVSEPSKPAVGQTNVEGGDNPVLAQLLAAVENLEHKIMELSAKGETSPEEDIDKAIASLSTSNNDEDVIEEDDSGVNSGKMPEEPEDKSSQDSDEEDKNDYKVEQVKDTAAKILKEQRKIIADIKDPVLKRKMADSILNSVRKLTTGSNNSIGNVLKATKSKMTSMNDSRKNISKEEELRKIEESYAAMNPHSRK